MPVVWLVGVLGHYASHRVVLPWTLITSATTNPLRHNSELPLSATARDCSELLIYHPISPAPGGFSTPSRPGNRTLSSSIASIGSRTGRCVDRVYQIVDRSLFGALRVRAGAGAPRKASRQLSWRALTLVSLRRSLRTRLRSRAENLPLSAGHDGPLSALDPPTHGRQEIPQSDQ